MENVRAFGTSTWSSLKTVIGAEEEEAQEQGLLGQINAATTLTWTQRLYGFGICLGLGIFFSLIVSARTVMPFPLLNLPASSQAP